MKKTILIAALLSLLFLSQASHAFLDSIIGGVQRTAESAKNTAYQAFMKIKIVQQLKVMRQNYLESRKYYNQVREWQEHRGGIGGYFSDEVKERLRNLYDDARWDFERDMNADPDDTAYVRKLIERKQAQIENALDYSEEIYNIGKKRDNELIKLSNDLNKSDISQKELDKLNNRTSILTLEFLSSIDKMLQKLFMLEARNLEEEWLRESRNLNLHLWFHEANKKVLQERQLLLQKEKRYQDALKVLREKPRKQD